MLTQTLESMNLHIQFIFSSRHTDQMRHIKPNRMFFTSNIFSYRNIIWITISCTFWVKWKYVQILLTKKMRWSFVVVFSVRPTLFCERVSGHHMPKKRPWHHFTRACWEVKWLLDWYPLDCFVLIRAHKLKWTGTLYHTSLPYLPRDLSQLSPKILSFHRAL